MSEKIVDEAWLEYSGLNPHTHMGHKASFFAGYAACIADLETLAYMFPDTPEGIKAGESAVQSIKQDIRAYFACSCGKTQKANCPGLWEPGCDFGDN